MESVLDATYVINMDTDAGRLVDFNSMMTSCNWKYERFAGINGKKVLSDGNYATDNSKTSNIIDAEKLHALRAMKNKYVRYITWLSASEIGCLLSHVSLWEEVATNPDKHRIAIFEDDARTHVDGNTIRELLADFYSHLTTNNIPEPDMLYLGKALDDCMSYEKVWGNVYTSKHPLCLHAYIITKSGAQKLLNMAPYGLAIDMIPINAIKQGLINVMAFHPSIYFQDVFNNMSNLRQLKYAVNHTTECLVSQQHITGDTWHYTFIIAIGLIAVIILFAIYMHFR